MRSRRAACEGWVFIGTPEMKVTRGGMLSQIPDNGTGHSNAERDGWLDWMGTNQYHVMNAFKKEMLAAVGNLWRVFELFSRWVFKLFARWQRVFLRVRPLQKLALPLRFVDLSNVHLFRLRPASSRHDDKESAPLPAQHLRKIGHVRNVTFSPLKSLLSPPQYC